MSPELSKQHLLSAAPLAVGILAASVAGVALAAFAGAHLAFMLRVTSNSMAPYVRAGDYGVAIYTDRIARGDVIVFRFPFGAPDLAIKRAAVLPANACPRMAATRRVVR